MIFNDLDLLRATEAAALAAAKWVGTGDKLTADKEATDEMRNRLNGMNLNGVIAIGEGKKDESYGLFAGERIGNNLAKKESPEVELAVDPIEGTRPTVTSGPEALSVMAVAEHNCFYRTESFYMMKLAYGPAISRKIQLSLETPIEDLIRQVSEVTRKSYPEIMVCVLDRPRHKSIVEKLRGLKVRIKLIQDCDVSGAIATCLPESGIDLLYGVGGAPEAMISAAAMKCLRGGFEAQLASDDGALLDGSILKIDDLVKGDCSFVASGITNGSLLNGVRYTDRGAVTNSVLMRSQSGTIRWIQAEHNRN